MVTAVRDLATNQMVLAGADAIYEDECFIFDLRLYRRYTNINGDNGANLDTVSTNVQDDRPIRLSRDVSLGVSEMPTPRRDFCSWVYSISLCGLIAFLAVLLTVPANGLAAEAPAKPSPPHVSLRAQAAPADQQLTDASRIAAVVNGDVISEADIGNRARLFAISTGLPLSTEVIDRLKSQILRQLIDERLRVQEAQRP